MAVGECRNFRLDSAMGNNHNNKQVNSSSSSNYLGTAAAMHLSCKMALLLITVNG